MASRPETGLQPARYRPATTSEPCGISDGIQAWK
jgi:hypothetical protein